jgi:lysophospholipase L1-like esterase
MTKETKALTKLDPRITEFQANIRQQFAMANQTAKQGQIVFVGSSLMEVFPIDELQGELGLDKVIYNRAIRATTTADLLEYMDLQIFDLAPSKIFINIGSNDVGFGVPEATFLANYDEILRQIKAKLPATEVYVMAYFPTNASAVGDQDDEKLLSTRSTDAMAEASVKVAKVAAQNDYPFIDVNAGLADEAGNLRKELTFDGAHIDPRGDGYKLVLNNMLPYLQ